MLHHHQHGRAREENREGCAHRAAVLPHAQQIPKPASTQGHAVPTASHSLSILKVFKYSVQHHKQFARCFGLSANSRKGNSGLLQPVAAPHYFSPCLGCHQSTAGTHAPLDILKKTSFYSHCVVWEWIATVCERVSRLSWVILRDSLSFSNVEHKGSNF